jgi:hypothetical protein
MSSETLQRAEGDHPRGVEAGRVRRANTLAKSRYTAAWAVGMISGDAQVMDMGEPSQEARATPAPQP